MAFQQFGGVNGICFYASEIFISAGKLGNSFTNFSRLLLNSCFLGYKSGFSSGNMGTIALAIINVPMTALGVFLMDKSGRRPLLLVR